MREEVLGQDQGVGVAPSDRPDDPVEGIDHAHSVSAREGDFCAAAQPTGASGRP